MGGLPISASVDGRVCIWDLPHGTAEAVDCGHRDRVADVTMTIDGRQAVTVGGDFLIVWTDGVARGFRAQALGASVAWEMQRPRRDVWCGDFTMANGTGVHWKTPKIENPGNSRTTCMPVRPPRGIEATDTPGVGDECRSSRSVPERQPRG